MADTDDFIVMLAGKVPEYLPEPYKSAILHNRSSLADVPEGVLREAVEICIKDVRIEYAAEHRGEVDPEDEIDPI